MGSRGALCARNASCDRNEEINSTTSETDGNLSRALSLFPIFSTIAKEHRYCRIGVEAQECKAATGHDWDTAVRSNRGSKLSRGPVPARSLHDWSYELHLGVAQTS